MEFNEQCLEENALILLKGLWYSELPPIIDFNNLSNCILNALEDIQNKKTECYSFDENTFVTDFKKVSSPPYIRKPGVEGITYYDFKNNSSLREMQIPNLKHYLAFIYNTLHMYDDIFQELYMNDSNRNIVIASNSYLMFEKTFEIRTEYDDETYEIEAGIFAEKNNKITGSAMLNRNRKLYYNKQDSYLFKMKIDLESFFPNLYTHYFHRIFNMEPFTSLHFPEKYFEFLDLFHQRINDNQTKGIPAGVFSSHVAAELCMLCVDYQINDLIKDKNISYVRYVDDFTFFSNSQELLLDLKIQIQQILNKFRLRINGNKTEIVPCVFDYPAVDTEELKMFFSWLIKPEKSLFTDSNLAQLKKHIANLLNRNNNSQIKTILTWFANKINKNQVEFISSERDCFMYMIQLSQTNTILASKAYSVINAIISKSDNRDILINKLLDISDDIDLKFSNTILQIWHYYAITNNCDYKTVNSLVDRLSNINDNPIILSELVFSGKSTNKKLFSYIKNTYTNLSGANNWRDEIMYSKFWLPLFTIRLKDGHDYEHWFNSKCYPDILKRFSSIN